MANFIGLVYATLKQEGIDTKGMSTDEAVAKYNELQKSSGGKSGEKEGTPAENRKMNEKGYTYQKNTKDGYKIINTYLDNGENQIIGKIDDNTYFIGYGYNEDTGKYASISKFKSMQEAEQFYRNNRPKAKLIRQNLSKSKPQMLIDTKKIDKTLDKIEKKQDLNKKDFKKKQLEVINEFNPMGDDYHVGIRKIDDIKTFGEVIDDDESFVWGDFSREDAKKALEKGKITIYSSKPINQGSFVSTSKNQAEDYAGGGKIYSREVPLSKVAWINGDEGQFADVD